MPRLSRGWGRQGAAQRRRQPLAEEVVQLRASPLVASSHGSRLKLGLVVPPRVRRRHPRAYARPAHPSLDAGEVDCAARHRLARRGRTVAATRSSRPAVRLSLAWQRLQTIDRTRPTLSRHESELARREVRADLKAVASAASAAAWMAACRCIELVIRRPAAATSSSATPPALASRSRCVCHRESGIVSRSSWLVDASDESASILSRVQMQTSSSAGRPKSDGEGGGGKGAGGGVEGEAVQASGAGRLCEAPMWTLSAIRSRSSLRLSSKNQLRCEELGGARHLEHLSTG